MPTIEELNEAIKSIDNQLLEFSRLNTPHYKLEMYLHPQMFSFLMENKISSTFPIRIDESLPVNKIQIKDTYTWY